MIGIFCKSFTHIMKMCETSIPRNVLLIVNGQVSTGVMVHISSNEVLFFQDYVKNCPDHLWVKNKTCTTFYERYGHVALINNSHACWRILTDSLGGEPKIIMLPKDFNETFEAFRNANKKAVTQMMDKYFLSENSSILQYYYCLSNANITFLQWAIKNFCGNRVPNPLIQYVLIWNEKYSQFANKLSKGTITAYNNTPQIMELVTELGNICKVKRSNDAIMQFNTMQKHLLKENIVDLNLQNVLSKFGRLSETKRQNFIRKMSSVMDYDDIFNQMSALCDIHFKWSRSSFMEYIKNSEVVKCEIIFDKDDVIVVKSSDYETIKRLGKTTNWCISKNKRYWNDYVEHRAGNTQYVLFDFNKDEDDEYSIVGFTTKNGGTITNAHSFTNADLMGRGNGELEPFNGFRTNIYKVLEDANVPLSIFIKGTELSIEWNKESLFSFLEEYCEDEYDVLCETENAVAFSVTSSKISMLYSKEILKTIDRSLFGYECVFFADFTKTNDSKLLVSFIFPNGNGETASHIYNTNLIETSESIDTYLTQFGLPYDTIKRVNDVSNRFYEAMSRYDITALRNILNNKEIVEELKKNPNHNNDAFYYMTESLFNRKSLSVLQLFKDANVKFSDIFGEDFTGDFIYSIVNQCNSFYDSMRRVPSMEDYRILGHNNPNRNRLWYIGFMKAFDIVTSSEDANAFKKLSSNFNGMRYRNGFSEYICNVILAKIPVENSRNHLSILSDLIIWSSGRNTEITTKIVTKYPIQEVITLAKEYGFSLAN